MRLWSIDTLVIYVLGLFFICGIWYGFPLTSIVFDEMFPGAVVRAMTQGSVFPQGTDVLYGTITYLINYVLIAPAVLVSLIVGGGSVLSTKIFWIEHTWLLYLLARLVSFGSVILMMVWFRSMLEKLGVSTFTRFSIIVLTFSNLIIFSTFHTSKVWIVTSLLIVGSLRCALYALDGGNFSKKSLVIAYILAALAMANFPLAGTYFVSLVCWGTYLIRNKSLDVKLVNYTKIVIYVCVLAGVVIAFNWQGVHAQLKSIIFDYTLSSVAQETNLSLYESVQVNVVKVLLVAPLLLVAHLVSIFVRARNKAYSTVSNATNNFWLLVILYLCVYFFAIIVTARWSIEPTSFLRYMVPVCLMLGLLLAKYIVANKYKKFISVTYGVLCTISISYMIKATLLLSVPPTYVIAVRELFANYNNVSTVILNSVSPLISLHQNQDSYKLNTLNDEYVCGSRCRMTIEQPNLFNNVVFKGIYLENYHKKSVQVHQKIRDSKYQVYDIQIREGAVLAGGGGLDLEDLGNYFSRKFWQLERLGKNIYSKRIQ